MASRGAGAMAEEGMELIARLRRSLVWSRTANAAAGRRSAARNRENKRRPHRRRHGLGGFLGADQMLQRGVRADFFLTDPVAYGFRGLRWRRGAFLRAPGAIVNKGLERRNRGRFLHESAIGFGRKTRKRANPLSVQHHDIAQHMGGAWNRLRNDIVRTDLELSALGNWNTQFILAGQWNLLHGADRENRRDRLMRGARSPTGYCWIDARLPTLDCCPEGLDVRRPTDGAGFGGNRRLPARIS